MRSSAEKRLESRMLGNLHVRFGVGVRVRFPGLHHANIGYAALSDFFYVWLRRTIGDLYPDLLRPKSTSRPAFAGPSPPCGRRWIRVSR